MKLEDLLIHRWCLKHSGRGKKGLQKKRRKKWDAVKHLAKHTGIKFH